MKRVSLAAVGLATLLSVALSGCGTTASVPADSLPSSPVSEEATVTPSLSPQGVYTDKNKSFQVTIPDDYIEDTTLSKQGRTVFRSPNGTRSVELKKLNPDSNLLAYSRSEFSKAYRDSFEEFQLQQCRPVTVGETNGVYLQFTCKQQGKPYTVAQYVMAGDSDYSVTYASVDGGADFLSLAQESIQTFRELNPEQPVPQAGRLIGTTYTDTEDRFTITLPSGWKVSSQTKDSLLFRSGDNKSNLNIQWGQSDKQLLRYQKSYFTQSFQESLGKSAKVTVFQTATLNGINARYLECTYTRNGKSLISKQYLLNSDNITYRITFTSTTANAGKTKFNTVADSFTLR